MTTGNFSSENSQIIENYLSKGHRADIIIGNDGKTPLHFAAEHGNLSLVNSLLIQPNVDVNALDIHNQTPLHFAYKSLEKNPQTFNNQIINSLLKHNANPDIVLNKNDETPLTIATQYGNYDLVASLVEKGAQVNIADHNKKTPLHFAFESLLLPENHAKFNSKIAEKLLDHGASHNIFIGNNLETPLTLALKNSEYDLANFIISKNYTNIINTNNLEETPFSIVIHNILQEKDDEKQEGNYTILKNLLAHGVNINACITKCKRTALIQAVLKEDLKLVTFLLENDADVSIPSQNGYENERETATRVATEKILKCKSPEQITVSHTILAKLLDHRKKDEIEKYFTLNYFKNPLIESINKKDFILTNLLLEHKVDINDYDNDKDTPLIAALREALKTSDPKDIKIVKNY